MSNYVLIGGFVLNAFRELFFHIDKFVYMIARGAYQVFCYISEITLEREDIVTDLTSRVYAILGILLVFIVTYNLLTYIINPDKISDNKVGASAVIKDIVIALAIIALTPTLFAKLYAFQNTIITSGVISNLILGGYSSSDVEKYGGGNEQDVGRNYIRMGANNMAANVFTAFFTPANNDFSAIYCNKSSTDVSSDNEIQQKNEEYSEYCVAYANMVNTGSMDSFGDLITKNKYEYWFIFSTIGGIILTLFMLSFCLNLAKRVFKLFILQFIAPVPVVMELIPSKKGARKRWFDNLVQVYLEVFFFQAVIFIVIYLISMVPELVIQLFGNKTLSNDTGGWFVKTLTLVFLIIGLLQFGKEAPQMIFDLLGIKSTGTISAMAKRALKLPGIGASAVGTGVTSLANNISNTVRNFRNSDNVADKIGSIAGGVVGSGIGFFGGLGYGGYANRSGSLRPNVLKRKVGSATNRVNSVGNRISNPITKSTSSITRGTQKVGSFVVNPSTRSTAGNTIRNLPGNAKNATVNAAQAGGKRFLNWATGGNQTGDATRQAIKTYKGIYEPYKFDDDNYIKDRNKDLIKLFTEKGISYDSFVKKSNKWIKDNTTIDNVTGEITHRPSIYDYLDDNAFDTDFGSEIATERDKIKTQHKLIDERKDTIRSKDPYDVATKIETIKKAASKDKELADLIASTPNLGSNFNLDTWSLDPNTQDHNEIISAVKQLEDISKHLDKVDKKIAYANAGRNQNDSDNNN